MKSLSQITSTRKASNQKSLVTYITAGLPGWVDAVHACCENGADIIEIGLPFSDPIMDGPVIAQASALALKAGTKTQNLLSTLEKESFSKPYAVMTYTNVLYAHGVKPIIEMLETAGVSGLILPDLTYEQSQLFSDALGSSDISLVQLISSTTGDERKEKIMKICEGFLYCVAIKGITGQNVDLAGVFTEFIGGIVSASPLPTYCGVGVRTPDDAAALAGISDGVIVGTSLVEKMIDNKNCAADVGKLVGEIRSAIDA